MSDYRITQLKATPNVMVRLRTRIIDGHGDTRLHALTLENLTPSGKSMYQRPPSSS